MSKKRKFIIQELIKTEEFYVENLKQCCFVIFFLKIDPKIFCRK
jgi:hypothetical protein